MLLAVDWSGDPGMKPRSLPRCIMTIVVCGNEDALSDALAKLRCARSLRKDFEFHYTKIDDEALRSQFMEAIAGKFSAVVAVYDKEQMKPKWAWGRDTDLLVQLIVHCVLSLPPQVIHDARMIIDGDREVRALRKVLRPTLSKAYQDRGIPERVGKIVPGRSEAYDSIQVADMVGGAVSEAVRRQMKEGRFLKAAGHNVTVLRITPDMEKPTE